MHWGNWNDILMLHYTYIQSARRMEEFNLNIWAFILYCTLLSCNPTTFVCVLKLHTRTQIPSASCCKTYSISLLIGISYNKPNSQLKPFIPYMYIRVVLFCVKIMVQLWKSVWNRIMLSRAPKFGNAIARNKM